VFVSLLQSTRIDDVLAHVNVPSCVIDAAGVIRWLNPAAKRLVGDVEGRQFTSVVAPEQTLRARELFARKVVGAATVTHARFVLVDSDGDRVAVEISSVPLHRGEHVVGVFGEVTDLVETPHAHPELPLTPRQGGAKSSGNASASTRRAFRSTRSAPSSEAATDGRTRWSTPGRSR
jgi:PAS domain S-box-containing protein